MKSLRFLWLLWFASCTTYPETLVMSNVTLVDLEAGGTRSGQTVIVVADRIAAIGPSGESEIPAGATVIEADGKFLIPGLWDMHTHVLYPSTHARYFPMLVANGVTGVRDMNGPMDFEAIDSLKRGIAEGVILGPQIVTPGPVIDGPARPASARGAMTRIVETPAQAAVVVDSLARAGADFVKVYHNFTGPLLQAVVEAAQTRGLAVVGHVPYGVPATEAARGGLASLEHLQGMLEACTAAGVPLTEAMAEALELLSQPGKTLADAPRSLIVTVQTERQRMLESFDEARCRQAAAILATQETWQVPTLVSNRGVDLAALDPAFAADERLAYIPAVEQDQWQTAAGAHPLRYDSTGRRQRHRLLNEIMGLFYEAGVPFLAGTDLGVPYVYAGFSLHEELLRLVEAGLSPLDALRAATTGPARFLGRDGHQGAVRVGYDADLVLLDRNPLEDIRHTQQIHAVVLRGHFYDRAALDEMLVAAQQAAQ